MKYFKLISVLILFLFLNKNSNSQTILNTRVEQMLPSSESISKIKSVIRPQEVYTGIPKISIPLWNNEHSNFVINADYHAQGIQVNEEASSIGLGWSLNTGGVIARIVRGYPDDMLNKGYLNISSAQKTLYNKDLSQYINTDVIYLNSLSDMDATPDIFYYDFHGIKGKFVFDESGNILSIPQNNLKIKYQKNYDNAFIKAFVITTPDGTIYEFTRPEHAKITSGSANLGYSEYKSAWYLTSVKVLESELVSYQYSYCDETVTRKLYDYKYHGQSENTLSINIKFTIPRLHRIQDGNSRVDISNNYATGQLNTIYIKALDYTSSNYEELFNLFTQISFTYGAYSIEGGATSSESRTRRLDQITIGKYNKKNYSFTYNSTPIPNINSKKQDLWGYYSNRSSTSLLPKLYYASGNYESLGSITPNIPGADRSVNPSAIEAGILTKVTNPTGGTTEYNYEPQSFNYNGLINGAGLRISEITYSDPNNTEYANKSIKYKYTDFTTNTPTGVLLTKPNFAYYLNNPTYVNIVEKSYVYANYTYGLNNVCSNPIFYKQVTVDDNGTTYHVQNFNIATSNLGYSYASTSNLSLSYSVFQLIKHNNCALSFSNKEIDTYFNYEWNNAYLQSEIFYDYSKNKVKEILYNYRTIEGSKAVHGFYVGPKEEYVLGSNNYEWNTLKKFYYWNAWKLLASKTIKEYEPGISSPVTTKTNSFTYDGLSRDYSFPITIQATDANGYTHTKQFRYPYHYSSIYDNSYYENKLNEKLYNNTIAYRDIYNNTNDDEKFIIRDIISNSVYSDIDPPTNPGVDNYIIAIETLSKRGMVSNPVEVVEKITFEGQTKVLKAFITKYKKLDNLAVVPIEDLIIEGPIDNSSFFMSRVESNQFVFSNDYKRLKKYETYGNYGELLETIGANKVKTSYKWSDRGNYLMAQVINADYTDIEEYTGSNENIRNNTDGLVTTYSYKPLAGIKRETDPRGKSTYYVYDKDGNLVAIKDNDKNIREIYSQNVVNGEKTINYEIDPTTDPDGNESFFDQTASASAVIRYFEGCNMFHINLELNPAFDYFIQYPLSDLNSDDDVLIPVNTEIINHKPNYFVGDYPITITVKKDGNIIDEYTKTTLINNTIIEADYNYNIMENGLLIHNFTSNAAYESIQFEASPSKGIGKYHVQWIVTVNGVIRNDLGSSVNILTCGATSSSLTFNESGTYHVTCMISGQDQTPYKKTKSWDFSIGNSTQNFLVLHKYQNESGGYYSSIDNQTLEYLKMQIKIPQGTGTFNVKWEVTRNGGTAQITTANIGVNTLTDGPICAIDGNYYVKCTVTQNTQTSIGEWNFTIYNSNSIPL